MRFAHQNIDHPLIDALVRELGLDRNRSVQHRFQTQAQPPQIGFCGDLSILAHASR